MHPKPARAQLLYESTLKPNSPFFFDFAWNSQYSPHYDSNGTYVDETAGLADVPNGQYAQAMPHPTDIIVAYDTTLENTKDGPLVYADQAFTVGANPATTTLAKSVQGAPYLSTARTNQPDVFVAAAANMWRALDFGEDPASGDQGDPAHTASPFGVMECIWIDHARNGARLGANCSSTQSGVHYSGYIFQSDTGSLECGRAVSLDGIPLPTNVDHRCPTGSPARSLGTFESRRLLIAGCLISSDAQYNPRADVHVPEYCDVPLDFKKGCLLHGATNYDPLAKQTGQCRFLTLGCMSSTALNYNPAASEENPLTP